MVWKERIIRERGELCRSLCLDRKDVDEKLASIDYEYDPEKNQYV